jgi:hypothetical protein
VTALQFYTNLGIPSPMFGINGVGLCRFFNLPGGLAGIGGYIGNAGVNGLYFKSNALPSLTLTADSGLTSGLIFLIFV